MRCEIVTFEDRPYEVLAQMGMACLKGIETALIEVSAVHQSIPSPFLSPLFSRRGFHTRRQLSPLKETTHEHVA